MNIMTLGDLLISNVMQMKNCEKEQSYWHPSVLPTKSKKLIYIFGDLSISNVMQMKNCEKMQSFWHPSILPTKSMQLNQTKNKHILW